MARLAKKDSPFTPVNTCDAGAFHWAEGSDNRIIYQSVADVAVQLAAFQEPLKKLPLDERTLGAFNNILRAAQMALDHIKATKVSEFGWPAIGVLRSQFSTADPSLSKQFVHIESSFRKKAKHASEKNKNRKLVV